MEKVLKYAFVVVLLSGSLTAAWGAAPCSTCDDDSTKFGEASAFLESKGFAQSEYTVLMAWTETTRRGAKKLVRGFHVRSLADGETLDLYYDAGGQYLDEVALAQGGIRPKNWDLPPIEQEAQWGTPVAKALPARPVRRGKGVPSGEALVHLEEVDVAAALAEDAQSGLALGKGVVRTGVFQNFAKAVGAVGSTVSHGAWTPLADGSVLWSVAIHSAGAKGQRLLLQDLRVPVGCRLIVYNAANPIEAYGPYDESDLADGSLWTATCFGETVVLECWAPSEAKVAGFRLSLEKSIHMYRGFEALQWSKIDAGACNLDVTCYPAWETASKGVGAVGTVGSSGSLFCSGSLLVDTDPSTDIPYFLTADHCVGSQTKANSMEVYWLYQTSACDGTPPHPASSPRSAQGDYLMGSDLDDGTDFTLLRLKAAPPASATYLGWSAVPIAEGTPVVSIHHPRGEFKRISFGTITAMSDTCLDPADIPGASHFHQVLWNDGTTESGSSGCPLLTVSGQKIIGQLYGGRAACTRMECPDYYGRFATSFPLVASYLADVGVSFTQSEYVVSEGAGVATLSVELATPEAVSFGFSTADLTAVLNSDYSTSSGVVSFDGVQLTAAFDVEILDDVHFEADERLEVILTLEGQPLATAIVRIVDDDVDSDGDGLRDLDETGGTFGFVTDPNHIDTDLDGISDFYEVFGILGFFTDPTLWDTDGDHVGDKEEIDMGFDPTVATDAPKVSSFIVPFFSRQ